MIEGDLGNQVQGRSEIRFVLTGKAEVVVCDGFVGNVLLKFAESVPSFFKDRITRHANGSVFRKLSLVPAIGTLRGAMKGLDYEEYGGVPLLRVKGEGADQRIEIIFSRDGVASRLELLWWGP